jgi:hypothetical protein
LGHIMEDLSKEPIKTFLVALLQRDIERTIAWLLQRKNFQQKAIEAIGELVSYLASRLTSDVLLNTLSTVFLKSTDGWARWRFLKILAIKFRNEIRIWNLIREAAISDPDAWDVRPEALKLLAQYQKDDPSTWQIIREAATKDSSGHVRREGWTILANHKRDDQTTWQIIREAATSDTDGLYVRPAALTLLANGQKDDQATWQITREAATSAPEWQVRLRGLELLANGQKDDPITWQMIHMAATKDANPYVRSAMCGLLLRHVDCDEVQRKLMSRNFNGRYSWHDPQELITSAHTARAAQELNLDVDEVRRQYEELATRLRIELNLEWRMRN